MVRTEVDPVCGMLIEPINAPAQTTSEGKTYYFCSQECQDKFDNTPERYVEDWQLEHDC